MTDIVERLRSWKLLPDQAEDDMKEAADELERLRAAFEFSGDRMDGIGLSR